MLSEWLQLLTRPILGDVKAGAVRDREKAVDGTSVYLWFFWTRRAYIHLRTGASS